jgi:hypothetical protein
MEDIRKGVLIVPAIRQLLLITKGMVKQQFNKHDKVTWHNKFVYSLCLVPGVFEMEDLPHFS